MEVLFQAPDPAPPDSARATLSFRSERLIGQALPNKRKDAYTLVMANANERILRCRKGRHPGSAGTLKGTFKGEAVRAFVPPALPCRPAVQPDRIQQLLEEANQTIGRLDGIASVLPVFRCLSTLTFAKKQCCLRRLKALSRRYRTCCCSRAMKCWERQSRTFKRL